MKIKEIKIVNQDGSTEIADIGADAQNVDYNNTTVKAELDKLNTVDNSLINTQISQGNTLTNLQSQVSSLASNVEIVFMPVAYYENSNASGDCTVLYDKQNKQTLMIDTGALHSYSLIKAKLVEMGITHIDFFILSHFHDDHFENYQSLIADGFFDEDTVFYLPKLPNSANVTNVSQNVNTFKSDLQNLDATIIYPTSETILNINNVKISFLNCNDADIEYYDDHTTDYNNYSICNYIEYQNNKILMTGDIQETAQKYLQENKYITKCDILKIPHHSWDTSGYNDFFVDTNPRYAVASINAYQHNNLQAKNSKQIAILNALGCDCYVLGDGEINISLNEGININSNSQKVQAKGESSEYLIELYVDNTFGGEYCNGTKTNPFTNLSSALAYAENLKNVRIDIYCNAGYSSNEELSIHDFRGLSIYNCSVNSMEITYSEIGLKNVTLTGTKDRALLINLSKVLINNVTVNGNNLSESHTGRGVGIYDSIVKVIDLSISNKKIALGLLDNSKVTIETLTGSNNNYLFSVSNNANYVCLTNSATYTTAETLVLSQNFNNAAGQTVYETRNSGNLNNLEAFASNIPRKVYISSTNLTNQPVAANGWLTSYYQSANTQVQIFIANSGNIYCRNKYAGTWQTWKSITMS